MKSICSKSEENVKELWDNGTKKEKDKFIFESFNEKFKSDLKYD